MNLFFTILAALPLGLLIRQRRTALLAYLIVDAYLFTFQTLDVLLNWLAGNTGLADAHAFGPNPNAWPIAFDQSEVYAYGIVNLLITSVGVGLVLLGHRIGARRSAAKNIIAVG